MSICQTCTGRLQLVAPLATKVVEGDQQHCRLGEHVGQVLHLFIQTVNVILDVTSGTPAAQGVVHEVGGGGGTRLGQDTEDRSVRDCEDAVRVEVR